MKREKRNGSGYIVRLLAVLALAWMVVPSWAAEGKPHILHIVADDLGWKDVGFNGCTDIKTPNLDALAKAGAKFAQFYVQPMCTPTRAALMTGRYPFRYGLQTAVIPSVSDYGLDTNEWLMPQCLKEAGYRTTIIGKWHLGHADKRYWPKQRGFDYQYGAMIGEIGLFYPQRTRRPGLVSAITSRSRKKGYTTTLIGQDAARLIEKHDPGTPLYLYLAFNAPHTPYQAPKEYIDRYGQIEDPTRRTYAAMISCLDDEVGRVVAALEKKKMRDNTLILFHSDNGGTRNAMFAGVMADMSKIKNSMRQWTLPRRQRNIVRRCHPRLRLCQLARSHQSRDRGRFDPRCGHLPDPGGAGRRFYHPVQAARWPQRLGHHRPRESVASDRNRLQYRTVSRRAAAG
jgi:arylsulfatase A-like enzyme